jgi:hypothetical protein
MKPKAVQLHQRVLEKTAGPAMARSKVLVHWKTADDGEVVLSEERTTTHWRVDTPGLLLLDFTSTVTAVTADVDLNGDPEHAGFQFRPSNALAEKPTGGTRKAKYLFHEDGADPKKHLDLPWVALDYALSGRPYSVLYVRHPDNPKGAKYSAYRDYGRFGSWLRHKLKKGESLTLRYRIYVVNAPMPAREECAARAAAFAVPPRVEVR